MIVEILKETELGRTWRRQRVMLLCPGDMLDTDKVDVEPWVLENLISRGVAKRVDLLASGHPPGLLTNEAPATQTRNTDATPKPRRRRKASDKAEQTPEPAPDSADTEVE